MKTRIFLFLACGVLVLAVLGCETTVTEEEGGEKVATYSYSQRELEVEYKRGIDQVYAAAQKALEDLELRGVSARQDQLTGRLVAEDAQENEVEILLEARGADETRATIQWGILGDKDKSIRVYRAINENLATS
jgi:hypothetical protein